MNGGISFLGVLGLTFIVLKLTEVIAWSWLWVLAPFWVGPIMGIIIMGLVVAIWGYKGEGKF